MNWDKVRRNQPLERWAVENPGLAREYRETGYLEEHLTEDIVSRPVQRSTNGSGTPRRGFTSCPECRCDVLSKNLDRHMSSVHPKVQARVPVHDKPVLPAVNEPTKESAVLAHCPVCQARVLAHRLQRHLELAHRLPSSAAPTVRRSTAGNIPAEPCKVVEDSQWITCNICSAQVLKRNYPKHCRKSHPQFGTNQPADTPAKQTSKPVGLLRQDGLIVRCLQCNLELPRTDLESHLLSAHTEVQSLVVSVDRAHGGVPSSKGHQEGEWMTCETCGVAVLGRNYLKHRRNVHPTTTKTQSRRAPEPQALTQTGTEPSTAHPGPASYARNTRPTGNKSLRYEDDPYDGGKYLGFFSREGGRFGTLPLFDDYSDESTP